MKRTTTTPACLGNTPKMAACGQKRLNGLYEVGSKYPINDHNNLGMSRNQLLFKNIQNQIKRSLCNLSHYQKSDSYKNIP